MRAKKCFSLGSIDSRLATAVLSLAAFTHINPQSALADTAVTANAFAPSSFALGLQFSAGWRFTVDKQLQVTHLGLYDWQGDGFEIAYPVAIWDGAGEVVAEAEVSAGMAHPLVGGFRYVSIESLTEAVLSPGQTYTIGYFQSTLAGFDRAVHFNGFHQINPLINQTGGGFITSQPSPTLSMPTQEFLDFEQWFGPSFQFNVVPAPGGLAMLALAAPAVRSSRRRA